MGCEGSVSALLESHASALSQDLQGRTPLHLAAACGRTHLLRKLLLAPGACDPRDPVRDHSQYTPTHWAAYHGERWPPAGSKIGGAQCGHSVTNGAQ